MPPPPPTITKLYSVVQYCTALYFMVLYCTLLHCMVESNTFTKTLRTTTNLEEEEDWNLEPIVLSVQKVKMSKVQELPKVPGFKGAGV